jgi:protein-disulfide isomerase
MKKVLLCAGIAALTGVLAAQTGQNAPQTAPAPTDAPKAEQKTAPPAAPPDVKAPQTAQKTPQAELKTEIGITREQAGEILDELRQIRQLLQRQAQAAAKAEEDKPKRAALSLKGLEPLGKKNAPVTMVEFTDYQCPFCLGFFTTTFPELKKKLIDTGKVRFYSRDFPLEFHPDAIRAAKAARCAGDQGKFWQYRDIIGLNPDKLLMPDLVAAAGQLKMNTKQFQSCAESDKFQDKIDADMVEAFRIGIDGTPAFVIGKSTPDGVEGEVIIGALPSPVFVQKLKDLGAK